MTLSEVHHTVAAACRAVHIRKEYDHENDYDERRKNICRKPSLTCYIIHLVRGEFGIKLFGHLCDIGGVHVHRKAGIKYHPYFAGRHFRILYQLDR